MKWNILSQASDESPNKKRQSIVSALLKNRNIADKESFLHPQKPNTITLAEVGIAESQVKKAIERLIEAVNNGAPIIIYGDYDADGVSATAVLWEALSRIGVKAYPFIPSRDRHGYGLSIKGIEEAIASLKPEVGGKKPLFITVDNGVVAHEAALYLKEQRIDVIITDHHQLGATIPHCHALIHTDVLAGAGVAWMLAKAILESWGKDAGEVDSLLDLATLGTIADMVPLLGVNRQLVSAGLTSIQHTKRPGLLALLKQAGIENDAAISTYHVNYIIAPRINAMGRLHHALDSLRLLLTSNPDRAASLAEVLQNTNTTRQDLTQSFVDLAKTMVGDSTTEHILIIDHDDFHEGVIGLVAGKLVETYYRPSIVMSRGVEVSKASVRSIPGVNIIKYLRQFSEFYLNAGGHPMAAGFTIETKNIDSFKQAIQLEAKTSILPQLLIPSLVIDCEISLDDITTALYEELQELKPFGIGNREPVFCTKNCRVIDMRQVGKTGGHLKLALQASSGTIYHAIGFNMADKVSMEATHLDVAYTIEENVWNGRRSLQLHLTDIK